MSEEKRLYPRLDFVCPAQCSFIESFPESFPVGIVDIGPEGFGFLCDRQLNLGVKLVIVIDLGSGGPIKFLTQVRWSQSLADSDKFKIGVKIFDSSNEDLEKLIRCYYRGLVPGQQRKKRILIIQNDRGRAELLKGELEKVCYVADCAFDGQDGFDKYIKWHPDLILLDLAITKMDAFEICRRIRKLQGDDKVVIFAMLVRAKDRDEVSALNIGIQKLYTAKISNETLVNEVHRTLSTDAS